MNEEGDGSRGGPAGRAGVFLLLVSLLAGACAVGTPHLYAPGEPIPPEERLPLKAHLLSGEMIVFERWAEDEEERLLFGSGIRYDLEREPTGAVTDLTIPIDSIALLEVTRSESDVARGVGLTLLAAYTVLTAAITGTCLADPKSCFGSCPTFYLGDADGDDRPVAEGFSASIARALEATDIDDLDVLAGAETFSLRMRNEALETHAVRSLRLVAVPEPAGGRVLATPAHEYRVASRIREPTGCRAAEGDCLEAVRRNDERERASLTDPLDLGARETVELEFPASAGRIGLVVGARHTFVSTFLFYQMLAYLGREGGAFLARVEGGGAGEAERIREVMGMLGRLDVAVLGSDGEWHPAGSFQEAGPLARDLHLVELPQVGEATVRVRLELTRGFWRIGYLGLAEIGADAEPLVLEPDRVERLDPGAATRDAGGPDPRELLLAADRYLVTEPGDHYRISFRVPAAPDGASYRLFLESTGHYYEWMRAEWMAEESPFDAALMLLQPETAFRRLAPEFKRREASMEEAFWNSRFRR